MNPGRPRAARRFATLPARTRVIIAAATIGIIVTAGAVDGLTRQPSPTDRVSDRGAAHPFRLPSVEHPDRQVVLSGGPGLPTVLNFWGSWCAPCRQELPLLATAARSQAGRVRFLGVDLEDRQGPASAMLARYGVPYDSGFDPQDSVANLYLLRGTPTTFFIDSKGHIVGEVEGALTQARLDWWLGHLS